MSFPSRLPLKGLLGAFLMVIDMLPQSASATSIPVDFTRGATQIHENCAREIHVARRSIDALVRTPRKRRTFTSIVLPLENASARLNDNLIAEVLLSNVSPDRSVRRASLRCENDVNDFTAVFTARPDLFHAVEDAIRHSKLLVDANRKLASLWITAMQRSGAALSMAERATFIARSQRLSAVQNDFSANLANDATVITLRTSEIIGLPNDFSSTFSRNGDAYVIPVNESTVSRFMENASDENARAAFFRAYNNRGYPANVTLLREALKLRDQLAHQLGYKSWDAYVLADRMAETPARVSAFLDNLDAKILPRAQEQYAALATLKARTLGTTTATLKPWDVTYYNNQLHRTKYAVDQNEVREYFPVDHVIPAALDIYAKLLGVTFTARKPADAWAPDVTAWSVSDTATNRFIGVFYLDLYPREGKYSHFANFPLRTSRILPDGTLETPISAIVGNWPRPASGHPALLSHDDVRTFFHEFGHAMAATLSTAPYETLSSGFRLDFLEAPSQMLENWTWNADILRKLSANVTTGMPLPDELIRKLIAARYASSAYQLSLQIVYSSVDLAYHAGGEDVDTTAVFRRILEMRSPSTFVPDTHPEASFGHLMNGYDAGYYGYLWSKVYAQDLFTAFEAAGLENTAVGERYRRFILEPARTFEPDVEVMRFLGRRVNSNAFYREYGLDSGDAARNR